MLRMPSSQPPTELSTMVSAGRIACCTADARNGRFQPGLSSEFVSYPWPCGKTCHTLEENRYSMISASKKYGIAVSRVVAGMIASSREPRFQPASAPRPMPSTKLITVAVPTRISVQ